MIRLRWCRQSIPVEPVEMFRIFLRFGKIYLSSEPNDQPECSCVPHHLLKWPSSDIWKPAWQITCGSWLCISAKTCISTSIKSQPAYKINEYKLFNWCHCVFKSFAHSPVWLKCYYCYPHRSVLILWTAEQQIWWYSFQQSMLKLF